MDISFDPESGRLTALDMTFADSPYVWNVEGTNADGEQFGGVGLAETVIAASEIATVVSGRLAATTLTVRQELRTDGRVLEEIITITNDGAVSLQVDSITCGLVCTLTDRLIWRLVAIPFRVRIEDGVWLIYAIIGTIQTLPKFANFSS
jgi:hypothetical protein